MPKVVNKQRDTWGQYQGKNKNKENKYYTQSYKFFQFLGQTKIQDKLYFLYKTIRLENFYKLMILGKYTKIKKLGKGAYGEVILAQDTSGNKFAIKTMNKSMFQKQQILKEYLDGEVTCMKEMSFSPYSIQLIEFEEDEQFQYLVCEYCNMGDLLNYQAKQDNKVFAFDKAVQIIAQIINGLEDLHGKGFLHRDLKPQNILIKNDAEKILYKLADFGFAKKGFLEPQTILGTQYYMAPQIYNEKKYGVQIDIWALGITFYFMLNLAHPFKINAHQCHTLKKNELVMQSRNFSYSKSVEGTLKKLKTNCNDQTQDFFRKIFEPDPIKRLTFLEIRQHPIFKKHFPEINPNTIRIYKSLIQKGMKNEKSNDSQIKGPHEIITKEELKKQTYFIDMLCSRVNLISEIQDQITHNPQYGNRLNKNLLKSFQYNINKLKIICMKDLTYNILNIKTLKKISPHLDWQKFVKHNYFKQLLHSYEGLLEESKSKIKKLSSQCFSKMDDIEKFNQNFQTACTPILVQTDFEGEFKKSYLMTTRVMYKDTRVQYKNMDDNVILKLLVISSISHVLWQIVYGDEELLRKAFKKYFIEQEEHSTLTGFCKWLTITKNKSLSQLAKSVISTYFAQPQ